MIVYGMKLADYFVSVMHGKPGSFSGGWDKYVWLRWSDGGIGAGEVCTRTCAS